MAKKSGPQSKRGKAAKTTSRARGTTTGGVRPRPHLSDVTDTNVDHPDAPGLRQPVAGAGIFPAGEEHSEAAQEEPKRRGTRRRPTSAGTRGTSAETGLLNPPSDEVGPEGSDQALAPELADPNFPLNAENHKGRNPPRELAKRLKPTNPYQPSDAARQR